jgi:hypothetical protein
VIIKDFPTCLLSAASYGRGHPVPAFRGIGGTFSYLPSPAFFSPLVGRAESVMVQGACVKPS